MSDGLRLCEDCGDAYTTGRYCTSCAHQRMIDAAESDPEDIHWLIDEQPDAMSENIEDIDDGDMLDFIECPKCHSTNWQCWDERSRECWNSVGIHVGTSVIGGLKCLDCGHNWLDWSVDGCLGEDDCDEEPWD